MNAFFRNRKRSEILKISTSWKDRKADAELLFGTLENKIRILLQYSIFQDKDHYPEDFPEEWIKFAKSAPLERITGLKDRISEARKQYSFNVNFQAIVEQLLLTFTGESDLWLN